MDIALLLSGGVDSAVAMLKLLEQGHRLHPFYIRIGRDDGTGGCAYEEDIEMCNLLTRRFNLPLNVVELHDEYWEHVMQYALEQVKKGLTPNPDIMCNLMIKFGFFEQRWGHNFDATATGHYATKWIDPSTGRQFLATAKDPVKDQTDFLARITYPQLCHAMFPLGDMPKAQVRQMAIEAKLPNANRRDSQGICFLGKINYNDFLRRHLGERPGPIVEIETGKLLGTHRGFWFHTIGQRKGLGLSGGPWFVVDKNVEDNTIFVSRGYDTALQYGTELNLSDMHWITDDVFANECVDAEIRFKNRHTPEFITGHLTRTAPGRYRLISEKPVQGIAPGQFGVIYTPDARLCLGSGVIVPSNPHLT